MPETEAFDNHLKEYERWFVDNHYVFQSELNAVRKAIPLGKKGVEIGIGSGIFAQPLGITTGIEPSKAMREKAKTRKINAVDAVAENLPYPDSCIDFALMVTTVCFLDDIYQSFYEVNRILSTNGYFIIGFVDKNSPLGKIYLDHKDESIFYKNATFYSTKELLGILKNTGFEIKSVYQTVFGKLDEINKVQEVITGYGKGSFVVIKAKIKLKL
ncbi:MAG: class I SAM-dependent methyltransferase [Bacteroidales bacterium]|nr:class I SAM-dependent methyltransferase [Bacteroidales bacterium]